jgi:XTP/dITP diphosphohydrolase
MPESPQNPPGPSFVPPGTKARALVLATSNPGKALEYQALLSEALSKRNITLLTLADFLDQGQVFQVAEETGQGFLENAFLKAQHYAKQTNLPALADDSGLLVSALGGAPGHRSARYGGPGLNDQDRNAKLISDLNQKLLTLDAKKKTREAYFETVLVLANKSGWRFLSWSGTLMGQIATSPRGSGGFGYDPIFIPQGYDQTLAELSADQKNSLSHRGEAIKKALKDAPLIDDWISGYRG